jgi:hypothetical protein
MESSDNKNNQRNRSNRNEDSTEDEIQKLLSMNNNRKSKEMMRMKEKYSNNSDLVDKIENGFQEKHRMITKKAKKFAKLIREKYSNQQYPFHVLLDKARLFKTKHGLTDNEFAEFQRIYEQELVGLRSPEVVLTSTNMTKVLGSINTDIYGSLKVNDTDYKYLQEILKLNASSKGLHSQVVLQSMQYEDCSFEATTGEYKRELGQRPGDCIHPVVAAMFLPKIDVLENHFLYSNISNIVKSRYNGENLTTRPDYELFYSLTNDPNDVVCDSRSPVLDLLTRAQLQNQLWNSVLHLRNGQYYNTTFREFIANIDVCKLNKQDNPDLVYGRFDGTILKRLLSAFSFRPTVVSTMPVYQVIALNPYQQNVMPVVTSIPMINLRLPPSSVTGDETVSLKDALEQSQAYLDHGVMVLKQTNLIYSRGVLFFYVDRRANVLRFNDMQPFNVSKFPLTISGFERLNDTDVDFDLSIQLRGDDYQLRSIVLAEVNNLGVENNVVVGSSTLIMSHSDPKKNIANGFIHYDPLNVNTPITENAQLKNRRPVNELRNSDNGTDSAMKQFVQMGRERGIIFMYQLVTDQSKGDLQY